MINNLRYLLFILFVSLSTFENVKANEPFIFNVTEIEILENGNQIKGYKGGTVIIEDGSKIIAENFFYNKLTNILEAIGNVKYIDETRNSIITTNKAIYFKNQEKVLTEGNSKAENENNIITAKKLKYDKVKNIFIAEHNAVIEDFQKNSKIYADEITYLKNEEKVYTSGETRALIEEKYIFNSENVLYLREIEELSSQKKSTVIDDNGNIYELANFFYDIKNEILKGKEVNLLAKVDKDKTDKFFFLKVFLILKIKVI